jgi:hypothetical protein
MLFFAVYVYLHGRWAWRSLVKIRFFCAGAVSIVLVLAGLLAACAPPLGSRGEGDLRIVLPGGAASRARAVIDPPEDLSYYQLDFSGPAGEVRSEILEPGAELTLTLSLGRWVIRAEAFTADGILSGSGEITVIVEAGRTNEAMIAMKKALSDITAFSFAYPKAAGVVDRDTKTIAVTVPFGTDVTGLVPLISFEGSTISPASGEAQNFTGPVIYTVTAANGDKAEWTVTVIVFSFTIEGPGDLMIPVTITHSGSISSTNISWSDNETLTFAVGSAYSVGAGNLKWLVNGEEVSAAGSSLAISARDYVERTYVLTAMIKESGQWYSGNYDFTVER